MQNMRRCVQTGQPSSLYPKAKQQMPNVNRHTCDVGEIRGTNTPKMQQRNGGSCLSTAPSLAMVYAPCQTFGALYDLEMAMKNGTIFSDLNKPFRNGFGG